MAPISNPYHYKAFRLKVNQVGKYPTSWSLKKLPKTGVHALSSPCRTTSLLVSKESDGRIAYKSREKSDVLSLGFLNVWPLHLHSFLSTNSFPLFLPFCFSFFSLFSFLIFISFSPHFLFSFWSFSLTFWSNHSFGQREAISSSFPLPICVAISFPCFFFLFLKSLL